MGQQLSLFEKPNLVEYFFLVSPPKEILEDVREIRAKIHSKVHLPIEIRNSVPHISLFEFFQMNRTEEEIIEKSNRALSETPAFRVGINNFGFFHHGREKRTIYLNVRDSGFTENIYASLGGELKVRTGRFTPHLTIVRSILARELEGIEDDLMNYEYANEFQCEKITLLKRERNDDFKTPYQLVSEFPLK